MARGLAHRHDVAHDHPRAARELAPQRGVELVIVADHLVDLGHRGVALGPDLGAAAGDHDARLRVLAPGAADRLARLALGLGGDRAGVHDDQVVQARRRAWPRITSDSKLFSRQPKVMISGPLMQSASSSGSRRPLKLCSPARSSRRGRPRSRRSAAAAVHRHLGRALGEAAAHRRDQGGAGAAAAGRGQAGAALPDPQAEVRGSRTSATPMLARSGNRGWCSSSGPSSRERHRFGVVDQEHRVRIAHAERDRLLRAGRAPGRARACPWAAASGISSQPKRGRPMSTV